jgi:hypothetical protein
MSFLSLENLSKRLSRLASYYCKLSEFLSLATYHLSLKTQHIITSAITETGCVLCQVRTEAEETVVDLNTKRRRDRL